MKRNNPLTCRFLVVAAMAFAGPVLSVACSQPRTACDAKDCAREYGRLPDDTASQDVPLLRQLGCDDPFTACVDVCDGRSLTKYTLGVAQGEKVRVRFVGKMSCKREHLDCRAQNVSPNNEGLRNSLGASSATAASSAANEKAKASSAASGALSAEKTSLEAASSSSIEAAPSASVPAALYAGNKRNATGKARPDASVAASTPSPLGSPLADMLSSSLDTRSNIASLRNSTSSTALKQALTVAEQKMGAHIDSLKSALSQAPGASTAAVQTTRAAAQAAVTEAHRIATDEAAAATTEAAELAQSAVASGDRLVSFGDCIVDTTAVPLEVRQITVTAHLGPVAARETTRGSAKTGPGGTGGGPTTAGGGPAPGAASDVRGGAAGTEGAANSLVKSGEEDALILVAVDHGNYWYDIGFVTAVVPKGTRTVGGAPRGQQPGDQVITVAEQTALKSGVALNLYPIGGHRRGVYSPFEASPGKKLQPRQLLGDLIGFQVAISPDLRTIAQPLFAGLIVEPITGLSLNAGAIFLQGDFLRAGYAAGMSAPADKASFSESKIMVRGYFALTFGFELAHTTTAKLTSGGDTGASQAPK